MTHRRRSLRLLALACAPTLLVPAMATAQVGATATTSPDAAGTVSAESADKSAEGDKFPLSASLSFSNSLGSGWLSPGYTMNPSFGQSVTPMLQYTLPKLDWTPNTVLSARTDVSVEWMDNHYTETYSRVPRLSDLFFGAALPGLYKEEVTGIGFAANFGARAPLSLMSRRWNVLGTLSAGGSVSWSTAHLKDMLPEWVGDFSLAYVPAASVTGHTSPNPSVACDSGALDLGIARFGNASENLERVPLVITREGEINVNGECIVPGRRVIGGFSNVLSLGWSMGKHSVNASAGLMHQLLAPLNDTPELSSPFSSPQNWSELSTGSISYSYSVPLESFELPKSTFVSLSAGLSSFQPTYAYGGRALRFPFWDFVTPANNFSAAFVSVDVGI